MAVPNCVSSAITLLERRLKGNMVKTCEAEQRSKLLMTLLRLGLLTREVKNFVDKQLRQQKKTGSKCGGKSCKTGKQRMMEKLADSRGDEDKLRKERDDIRKEFEEAIDNKNRYNRTDTCAGGVQSGVWAATGARRPGA